MAKKSGEQRRSGHKRFKTAVKNSLAVALKEAGFVDGERLFWRRDQRGNIHGIDFKMGWNEWIVNVGFHFGFLPGQFSWSQDCRQFGLLDFCLNWRPSGIGKSERWVALRDSTEETVVGEAQAAIESLDTNTVKWADPKALLTTVLPEDICSEEPYPCPPGWEFWTGVGRDTMAFLLATLARQDGHQDLARRYVEPVVELIPYPWFRKRAEDILGEKL